MQALLSVNVFLFTIVLSENGALRYRTLCTLSPIDLFSYLLYLDFTCSFLHHIDVFCNGLVELHLKASSQCFFSSLQVFFFFSSALTKGPDHVNKLPLV